MVRTMTALPFSEKVLVTLHGPAARTPPTALRAQICGPGNSYLQHIIQQSGVASVTLKGARTAPSRAATVPL